MSEQATRAELMALIVARGLKGYTKGEWFMTYCPAHGDGAKHGRSGGKDAGQSLGLSKAGVLKCHAGCTFAAVMKELRGDSPQPLSTQVKRPATEGSWTLRDSYEYRNAAGELVAVKGRWERENPDSQKGYDKKFSWRMPDHDWRDGIRKYGLEITDVPLWGAEMVAASPAGTRVWFTEGEAAAKAIRARNELAVTAAWGASQREFGQAFEVLRGHPLLLWPDNDGPGREYMAAVQRPLRRLARQLVVLNPPVPPAGDAVDYFRGGGTVERLLEGVLLEPTVDVYADNHLGVRIPTDHGVLEFAFKEMYRGRGELNCELTVTAHSAAMEPEPLWQRFNLLSGSAKEGLIRLLKGQFGSEMEPTWATVTSIATSRCRKVFEAVGPVEELAGIADAAPAEFIVNNLVVAGGGAMLFGPPGKGKSQTAMLIGVSVDAGVSDLFGVPRARRVLYVNLERSAYSQAARLGLVNVALGFEAERPLLFLNARGKPLADVLDRIKDCIRAYGVELVILDSLSRAGYGNLNENNVANAAVDALNSLRCGWLAIAHTPRGDDTHIFGSVHHDAGADVMISLTSVKDATGTLGVGLAVTKSNDFWARDQLQFIFEFDERGLRAARRARDGEIPDLEDHRGKSSAERIRAYLTATPGGATIKELSETLGIAANTVVVTLRRHAEFISLPGSKPASWVVSAEPAEPVEMRRKPRRERADGLGCFACEEDMTSYLPNGRQVCDMHFAHYVPKEGTA